MTFVDKKKFAIMESKGEIFQKEVIGDNFYGGDRKRLQEILNKKEDAILIGKFGDIGKEFPNVPVHHVGVFITKETQKKRLADRDTETPEKQAERVARYESDMAYANKYVTFEIDNNADLSKNGVLVKSALPTRKFVNFILENRERSGIADLYAVVPYKKKSE
jgi:guanylate kinase